MTSLLMQADLLAAVNGECVAGSGAFGFTSVATDSRSVMRGSLFVPLLGEHQDGHAYIGDAVQKGATVIFVSSESYKNNSALYKKFAAERQGLFFISVADTLCALQDAAAAFVEQFPRLKKIGVTGSSGKTTTKEIVAAILRKKYRVVCNEGNLNSETGLPLSVFKIVSDDEIGVFEMGMNRKNEIGELARVLKAQYALVTNVGTAHIGLLGSRQNIAEEKRKIFDWIPSDGAAFIPAASDFADFLSERVKGKIIKFGKDVSSEKSGVTFIKDAGIDGTVFKIGNETVRFHLPGIYNYENALAGIAVGKYFNVDDANIKIALEDFKPLSGRGEMKNVALTNGVFVTLIDDCYNANPDSMAQALAFCASDKDCPRRIYVLGDMLELGNEAEVAHAELGRRAIAANPYAIVFIGNYMKAAFDAARAEGFERLLYLSDSSDISIDDAAKFIINNVVDGALVLLKASRALSFERIIPLITRVGRNKDE